MQGVGTRGHLGRPDAEGRRPDGMSTQRRIQNCDLRLVRPVPQTHPAHQAHQAQSEILADVVSQNKYKHLDKSSSCTRNENKLAAQHQSKDYIEESHHLFLNESFHTP